MNFFSCESELKRKRGFVVNRGFVDGWKYEDKGLVRVKDLSLFTLKMCRIYLQKYTFGINFQLQIHRYFGN